MKNTNNLVILGCILMLATITRLFSLGNPHEYYFDEVYHAVTAKAYANNNPAGYEWWHEAPEPGTAYEWLHPPIAKLLMALGWKYLGQTAWAWRVPGAIVGVLTIATIYWLALIVSKKQNIALISAGIASLDGLLLVMSRIGMNDIYVTLFMLLAIGTYWTARQQRERSNWWLLASSVSTGLAMSTKWSGIFLLGMMGTWELIYLFEKKRSWWKRLPKLIIAYGLIPGIIYITSYGQFWLQGHTWDQFVELHNQIWWYQTNLKATHDYQSQAWEWPLAIRPVWMWVHYDDNGQVANIYNQGNPLIFWIGLAVIIGMIMKSIKERSLTGPELIILVAYSWSWMPWLMSPRIMFSYHYTPAVAWLTISVAMAINNWWRKKQTRMMALLTSILIVISFVWLSPMWLGIPLNQDKLPLMFWLPSWK